MASIDRTAYPRFKRHLSTRELETLYTPTPQEIAFAQETARGSSPTLSVLVLLKAVQHLGYFPRLDDVPPAIVEHMRSTLRYTPHVVPEVTPRTRYKYHQAIRVHLGINPAGRHARHIAARAVYAAAQVMDNPADLINVAIEELIHERCELPAYTTLDRLAQRVRALVNRRLFRAVSDRLAEDNRRRLDALLDTSLPRRHSPYNDLKQLPKRPTRSHLQDLLAHTDWLTSLGDVDRSLEGVPALKVRHFAAQCKALDAREMKDLATPKRLTLLICLLHQAQVQARDDLAEMLIKRMNRIHVAGKDELERLRAEHRETIETLVAALADVLGVPESDPPDVEAGQRVKDVLTAYGGVPQLLLECEAVSAYTGNNDLPLLWRFFRSHRSTLFRLARTLTLRATTQDQTVMAALRVALDHQDRDSTYLPVMVDLSFATEQWQRTILVRTGRRRRLLRRPFEVCVFTYLAAELKSGDIAVVGSDAYADYREQLLPWEECAPLVADYCRDLALPATAAGFVHELRTWLADVAAATDAGFPTNDQLDITPQGEPILKRLQRREPSPTAQALEAAILERLPEHSIIEVLANAQHWTGWARHFGPLSGSDPKVERPTERHILTTFAFGCNLGPVQAARHLGDVVTPHMLSFINRRHVTATKLDAALRDLIDIYARFGLPLLWGEGTAAAADGTKFDVYEENMVADYSIRYGSYGGIAYHHVSDRYVAIFSHFIPCGVWEAIYIIEGLLKNTSSLQPTTVHADTQGQSTPVFALAHLLGIQLHPRIRNWKDLTFYRPTKDARYQHIDVLFGDTINWALIETHWPDLLQVVLSIKAGKISTPILLRKLGNESHKNRLYQAFRELGRVVRTVVLLRYISDLHLREEIQAGTNKVEAYNGFSKFCFFGGDGIITENDPEEQEKRVKYLDIVATSAIVQTVVDMSYAIRDLIHEGYPVTRADVATLSPYITRTIKRFGDYVVNLDVVPTPLAGAMELPLDDIQGTGEAEQPA